MQVTETLNEGLQREFLITIPAADLDAELSSQLVELAPRVQLPGFRPGKVPPSLLRQRYGDEMLAKVIDKSISDSSQRALEERELRPAAQPRIEITSYEKGDDLEYKVSVELMPKIDAIDFSTLDLERLVAAPAEKEVMRVIERMAKEQKESAPIKEARPAAIGDVVIVDFIGKVDGEPFADGAAEDYNLELGSNTLVPGFEDQLVGVEAGSEKAVTVTFPDDYPKSDLAGREVVFDVKLKEIRAPKAVEIDDAFAQRFGMDSLDALKEVVGEQVKGEFLDATRARLKRQLLDKLAERHSFEVPPNMVEQEYRSIVREVVPSGDGEDGRDHDHDDGDNKGHEAREAELPEKDRAEYRSIAERRVRLGLLFSEVGRQNNIDVTDEEMHQAILKLTARFPGQEQFFFKYYQDNPQALAQIRAPIFEDKVVDFVIEMAKVTDKEVSVEELFREPDDDDGAATEATPAKKAAPKKKAAKTAEAQKPAAKAPTRRKAKDPQTEQDKG